MLLGPGASPCRTAVQETWAGNLGSTQVALPAARLHQCSRAPVVEHSCADHRVIAPAAQLGGKPDLIIGNYSDGNLVSSLLSHHLNTTQCTIAHALEKTKYPVRALASFSASELFLCMLARHAPLRMACPHHRSQRCISLRERRCWLHVGRGHQVEGAGRQVPLRLPVHRRPDRHERAHT